MYDRYLADPTSVSDSWREFFADYRSELERRHRAALGRLVKRRAGGAGTVHRGAGRRCPPVGRADPGRSIAGRRVVLAGGLGARWPICRRPDDGADVVTPLRGAAGRIVANMEASLGYPPPPASGWFRPSCSRSIAPSSTISSSGRRGQGQFHPSDRLRGGQGAYRRPGHERLVRRRRRRQVDTGSGPPPSRGLGLAVDVEKGDGSRTLLVPCITDADTLDFRRFVGAYEELVRKIRTNKIGARGLRRHHRDPDQSGNVGNRPVGAPTHGRAGSHRRCRALGSSLRLRGCRSPDHGRLGNRQDGDHHLHLRPPDHPGRGVRALPGLCVRVPDGGTRLLPRGLRIPRDPLRAGEHGSGTSMRPIDQGDGDHLRLVKQVHVQTLINMYRVRGHLIAHLDPAGRRTARSPPRTRPAPLRLDHLGPAPPVRVRRAGRQGHGHAGRDPAHAPRCLLPDAGDRVHAHPGSRPEALDPTARRGCVLGPTT